MVNLPSRFLLDIPSHLVMPPRGHTPEMTKAVQPSLVTKTLLNAGEHVRHAKFGEGIVVSCLSTKDDQEITVAFKGEAGLRRLLLSLAPLERIQ